MSYENDCSEILDLFIATGKEAPHEDSNLGRAVQILQTICDAQHGSYIGSLDIIQGAMTDDEYTENYSNASELFEALDELEDHISDSDDDFNLNFDGNEYRIIAEPSIESIFRDTIENLIDECYPEVKEALSRSWPVLTLDLDASVEAAMQDGYGHTFSGYDGSEEEAAGFYIFRTN